MIYYLEFSLNKNQKDQFEFSEKVERLNNFSRISNIWGIDYFE